MNTDEHRSPVRPTHQLSAVGLELSRPRHDLCFSVFIRGLVFIEGAGERDAGAVSSFPQSSPPSRSSPSSPPSSSLPPTTASWPSTRRLPARSHVLCPPGV